MATRVTDEFGARANPPDAAYPDGSLKNATAPGANDGSPVDERVGNDWEGTKQYLLQVTGTTPNGQPDSVSNPQIGNAIEKIANAGDSQLAGGPIWPLSIQESAKVGDTVTGYSAIKLNDGGTISIYKFLSRDGSALPPTGILDSFSLTGTLECTVSGVDYYLLKIGLLDLQASFESTLQVYDSVASMKSDLNIFKGYIVRTLSYYSGWAASANNPRGGNYYLVVDAGTGTDDGGSYIDLDNGLQAEGLFLDGSINADQFGAIATDLGATDSTVNVTNAAAYASTRLNAGGGWLDFGDGTYKFNIEFENQLKPRGLGSRVTTFIPAIDDVLIKTKVTENQVRIGGEGFRIDGNPAFTNQSGILLSAGLSLFIDDIVFRDVEILNCGRFGLKAFGTSTAGPFVQKLHLEYCTITNNAYPGISLTGDVIENTIIGCSIASNGDDAGTRNNAELNLASGRAPARVSIQGGLFNHQNALSAGKKGTALHVQGCQQLDINCADFENSDPMINITNAITGNVTISTSNFGTTFSIDDAIKVENCNGLVISNNKFAAAAGQTITNGINLASLSDVRNVEIDRANRFENVTNNITQIDNTTISGGSISYYGRLDFRVDTEGGAASDDLDNIFDSAGGTDLLVWGDRLSMRALNLSNTIVVKHATGNIRTMSGADVSLDEDWKTFNAKWEARLGLWIEV